MIQIKKLNLTFFLSGIMLISSGNIRGAIDYLDTTFGPDANGIVKTTIGELSQVNGIKIDSNGKIVAAGYTQTGDVQNIAVARYNSDGSLDTSFNSTGKVTTLTSGATASYANAVAIDSSNKILVAGTTTLSDLSNIMVARYTTAGALDATFGTGGVATLAIGDGGGANSIIIDANNKIVVVGTVVISGQPNLFVARFNSDGTLDTGFGTSGYTTVTGGVAYLGNCVKIDSNAKIVACGNTPQDFLLIRFNADGTLDTSFGVDETGIVVTPIPDGVNSVIRSMVLDSSNRAVVAGSSNISGNNAFVLARYDSSGSLDTTFGNDSTGIVIIAIGTDDRANAVTLDLDEKIVAGGIFSGNLTTARFDTNGSLDTTFGIGGAVITTMSNQSELFSLAVQASDGRVVAGGYYVVDPNSGEQHFVLVRYNKNNTDFVNTTSIADNSTINTKIPVIAGTSSAPNQSVNVYINGVLLGNFATDGSGDWNAGTSTVLPIGANTIRVDLIVSAAVVVSHVTKFTVTDNLSEDSVFAYNSTSQTKSTTNAFTALPFDNVIQLQTWTYSTSEFTCNKSGRYLIEYMGHAGATGLNTATYINVAAMIAINGTEYIGSEANANTSLTSDLATGLSNSFVKDLTAGDTVSLNYGVRISAVAGSAGFIVTPTTTGTQPAYTLSIVRIG